ncbi:mutY [Mytilus edulis]|uniref:MutY n=1 Tax=Mytilus edulis TaxID=6550 RepID=A0A8S3TL71_MYTED|nr:mutY [Mytilus edulis]
MEHISDKEKGNITDTVHGHQQEQVKTRICHGKKLFKEEEKDEEIDFNLCVQNYPRKGKKKAAREEQTKVCIVCKKNKSEALYCIVQRPEKGLLAGFVEFPSLKIDGNCSEELSPQQLLIDSCGLHVDTVTSTCHVGEVVHLFSHIHQTYIIDSITVEEEDRDTEVTDPP